MTNYRIVSSIIVIISMLSIDSSIATECPLEVDPVTILSCVAIDAVGLVEATKGNLRVFCTMAERFMECIKTKTRGCFGEEFVRGSLSELIELSQKCCVNKGEKISDECPFTNRPQCFSLTDRVKSSMGAEIPIGNLRIGDEVLAMDEDDRIVKTEIVSIIHYENERRALFYTFETETGHQISLTPEHLIYVGNESYLQARSVDQNKHQLYVMTEQGDVRSTAIRSIQLEIRSGYATPITKHGTLLVNQITSSCYSSIYHHRMGHLAMAPLRWSYHLQQIFGQLTNDPSHNGLHWYPKTLNNVLHLFPSLAPLLTSITGKL